MRWEIQQCSWIPLLPFPCSHQSGSLWSKQKTGQLLSLPEECIFEDQEKLHRKKWEIFGQIKRFWAWRSTVRATAAQIRPILADCPTCGPPNCNWCAELGFNPPLMCFTIITPWLSAFVRKTIKVDRTTDTRGATAGNQKSFLFLLPWEHKWFVLFG